MAVHNYTANHKQWDHIGNLTPNLEYSEGVRPHFELQVAPWLPVNGATNNVNVGLNARYDVRFEEYVVISTGKVVAATCEGHVVPAGWKIGLQDIVDAGTEASAIVLEYTAVDVSVGTFNLFTQVAVTAAVTYTYNALQLQLQQLGLLSPTDALVDFVSRPAGLAMYDFFQAAGTDRNNPSTYRFHNHKLQDLVSIVCDYVVKFPHVPHGTEDAIVPAFADSFAIANLDDNNANGIWGSLATFQTQMDRYDDDTNADAVGLALRYDNGAKHTSRTPIAVTTTGSVDKTSDVLVTQRFSVSDLAAAGDWFWDYQVGVLWLWDSGANALPADLDATDLVTFYHYHTIPTGSSVTTFASFLGNVCPGDFVTYNVDSNLVVDADFVAGDVAWSSSDATELAVVMNQVTNRHKSLLGQVLGVYTHPRQNLQKVRTSYAGLGTMDQMPGSASAGYSDNVTYASASDREVVINLLWR